MPRLEQTVPIPVTNVAEAPPSIATQLRLARERIAELEASDSLKTQILANISHDLRTPLTAVITHAEILRDGILGPLSPRQLESIGGIINGGHQLLRQVGEILTYARGQANQLTLSPTQFHLADVVAQLTSLNQAVARKKGVTLTANIPLEIQELQADREKIQHVLANLLGNALDFTPAGGRVWISARCVEGARGPECEVEVGDTGIGIDGEHHDLVFQEFAQVDSSASRPHHGTGLGLTIARKLVELHGGRIWLDSQLGAGSRFYFSIPYPEP